MENVDKFTPSFFVVVSHHCRKLVFEKTIERILWWPSVLVNLGERSDWRFDYNNLYETIRMISVGFGFINIVCILGILWDIHFALAILFILYVVMCQLFLTHSAFRVIRDSADKMKIYTKIKKPLRLRCLPGARYRFECKRNGTLYTKLVKHERMEKWVEK